jgi:hypothetical protein
MDRISFVELDTPEDPPQFSTQLPLLVTRVEAFRARGPKERPKWNRAVRGVALDTRRLGAVIQACSGQLLANQVRWYSESNGDPVTVDGYEVTVGYEPVTVSSTSTVRWIERLAALRAVFILQQRRV